MKISLRREAHYAVTTKVAHPCISICSEEWKQEQSPPPAVQVRTLYGYSETGEQLAVTASTLRLPLLVAGKARCDHARGLVWIITASVKKDPAAVAPMLHAQYEERLPH